MTAALGIVLVGPALAAVCLHRATCLGADTEPVVDPRSSSGARRARASSARVSGAWARALAAAGIDGDPAHRLRVTCGSLALLVALGAARGGPVGGVALGTIAVAVGVVALLCARGRGDRRADARLPDLLEHAGRNLRSGLDLVSALESSAAAVGGVHGAAVAAATGRVASGARLAAALQPWVEAHARPPVRLAVGALEVASHTGGAPARALDGVAATLRARAVVADEARSLASQARASAAVLVALPVVVAAMGAAADPELAHTLLATPLGLGCLVTAAVLDTIGGWWMQRIVGDGR